MGNKKNAFFVESQKRVQRFFSSLVRVSLGQWLLNFIVQRVFGVNRAVPWMVHYTSRVTTPKNIRIGKNVWLSFALSGGCYVQGGNGVFIGDDTLFGPGVKIISSNHDMANHNQWVDSDPIKIGERCWIGANAVILPGVSLGDECVVGAGAVVTKSFPARSVIGGVPAKLLNTNKA